MKTEININLLKHNINTQIHLMFKDMFAEKLISCIEKSIEDAIIDKEITTPQDFILYCCDKFDVSIREIESKSRLSDFVLFRCIIAFYLRKEYELTYFKIAELLGNKDHTSIIHYIKVFNNLYATNDIKLLNYLKLIKK
jgi:chromosomal replication initiation ATPase DnaA